MMRKPCTLHCTHTRRPHQPTLEVHGSRPISSEGDIVVLLIDSKGKGFFGRLGRAEHGCREGCGAGGVHWGTQRLGRRRKKIISVGLQLYSAETG